MAEVQKTTEAGEMTQLFIQFMMMQQQQALLALGRHPNPPAGAPRPNLQLGKVFVDQLGMLKEKTRGNLTPDEQHVMNDILASLQMAYVEATKG
jgi:hypothetical protein